jgi:pimeloyl-ACP methyl ester carboxylesterase
VEKLILCSPPMGRKDHLALVTRTIRTILENFPPEEAMMKFLELAVSERYATENRERLLDIVRWDPLDGKRKRIMEAQLEIIEGDEGKWPLDELPTLVIAGCEDKLLGPGEIIWLKSQMGQRKFVAIPHVGHNPVLEAPQRVATEILAFCSPKAHLFP